MLSQCESTGLKKIRMKNKISIIVTASAAIFTLYSCYYDKADILYGDKGKGCDTLTTVSYSISVKPVLDTKCYGCHSGGSPSGGIAMGTYSTDKAIAANGKLYGSINHSSGYSPMPEGEAKMDACTIAMIKQWIDAGSPNN